MKKKLIFGSIFLVLLMFSMPFVTNIQAQTTSEITDDAKCPLCANNAKQLELGKGYCRLLATTVGFLNAVFHPLHFFKAFRTMKDFVYSECCDGLGIDQ